MSRVCVKSAARRAVRVSARRRCGTFASVCGCSAKTTALRRWPCSRARALQHAPHGRHDARRVGQHRVLHRPRVRDRQMVGPDARASEQLRPELLRDPRHDLPIKPRDGRRWLACGARLPWLPAPWFMDPETNSDSSMLSADACRDGQAPRRRTTRAVGSSTRPRLTLPATTASRFRSVAL